MLKTDLLSDCRSTCRNKENELAKPSLIGGALWYAVRRMIRLDIYRNGARSVGVLLYWGSVSRRESCFGGSMRTKAPY